MARPNIVGLGTIVGFTTAKSTANASELVFLDHPAASLNKVIKVNSIIVTNTTSAPVNATISLRSASGGGGTAFKLTNSTPVAAYSSLVVIDKASALYLEENRCLTITSSSASGLLDVTSSYEEIT
ncbi:hypothetical protein EBQ91_01450 [bacterium]|nr:hypothetical protein [bacterium]